MRRIGPAVMGALVLLAVAALATMGLSWIRHQRGLRERLTARDAIHAQVRGILLNQGVIKMAARFGTGLGNPDLAACVLERHADAPPCTVTSPAAQKSFTLPESKEPSSPIIVGDVDRPAPYSSTGAVGCEEDKSDCPGWTVTAWFWADCPGAAETCDRADAIHVRYIVRGTGPMAAENSYPDETAFFERHEAFAETITMEQGGEP